MLKLGINSFIESIEEANGLVNDWLNHSSEEFLLWQSLDDVDKEIVIRRGTLVLDTFNYKGRSLKSKYDLKFPREINGNIVVPEKVKVAVILQGLYDRVLSDSEEFKLMKKGVKSMKVGSNSVTYDTTFNVVRDDVMYYIKDYLKISGSG